MHVPPDADALWYAVQIQRDRQPRDWPAALTSVPEQFRPAAEDYLRGMAQRMRYLRSLRSDRDHRHQ